VSLWKINGSGEGRYSCDNGEHHVSYPYMLEQRVRRSSPCIRDMTGETTRQLYQKEEKHNVATSDHAREVCDVVRSTIWRTLE